MLRANYYRRNISVFLTIVGLSLHEISLAADAAAHNVALFSQGEMSGWEEKSFSGTTLYQLSADTPQVLEANIQESASGLFKKISVNLKETPILHWRWKVEGNLSGLDERTKEGDDYLARIYVVAEHPWLFWKTRAINYVWSSNQPRDSVWDNAYASQAKMVAVRGFRDLMGRWQSESRDVGADFQMLFSAEIESIDVIAIMSDADNSGREGKAWYGDIYFAAE